MGLPERAAELPTAPGVYLFKSERGRVLYVGKAQNLRARVRQYVGGSDGRLRIPRLVERAADVDVVLTPSVKDALLLENELIKRHKPPFNVRLRDDKQYLALRLDPRETWPRLTQVRRFADDGAHYFGPYTSSTAMREALAELHRVFPLRTCSDGTFADYARRGRPCIEYEMQRCPAPCCDRVDAESYAQLVRGTELFLRGRSSELVEELGARMQEAAAQDRFEEAARLRDQIGAIERTLERQQIVAERPENPSDPPHCSPIEICSAEHGSRRTLFASSSISRTAFLPSSMAALVPPTLCMVTVFSILPAARPCSSKNFARLFRSQPSEQTTAPAMLGWRI